ncbi:hypothetical protein [Amycolatopsis samaneae]|uniref:Uncharacterized protein n=1 Tax=Amycolatopsis samaneae TaxID=664691 RepID=A0ABW5GKA9_9PSEU
MRERRNHGQASSTTDYVVAEQKGRLYPVIVAAAYALKRSPVWEYRRAPIDPLPLCEHLEQLAAQAAFFSTDAVNARLDGLLAASVELANVITVIHRRSRPGFRGAIDPRFHDDHQNALTTFDTAIRAFAAAARDDFGIPGTWHPITPRAAALRLDRRLRRDATP